MDHYGLFFRRCAIATLPGVLGLTVGVAVGRLAAAGLCPARVGDAFGTAGMALWFGGLLLITPVGGLLVPAVVDLLSARRPRPPPPAAELWRATWGALPAALVVFVLNMAANVLVRTPVTIAAQRAGTLDPAAQLWLETALAFASAILASAVIAPFVLVGGAVAVERSRGLGRPGGRRRSRGRSAARPSACRSSST